jgi:hypothetical protein
MPAAIVRVTSCALVVAASFNARQPADAARVSPAIIRIAGPSLARPVVITYRTNLPYVLIGDVWARRAATPPIPDERPFLEMALYWGPKWIDYVDVGRPLAALVPGQADQTGRFYPAWRGQEAFVTLGPLADIYPAGLSGTVSRRTLTALAVVGVPITLEE